MSPTFGKINKIFKIGSKCLNDIKIGYIICSLRPARVLWGDAARRSRIKKT